MTKRVTIYDIAKKLDISPSTVSRVLGKSDYPVSEEVRELVLRTAKEMNYLPNLWARNLKTKNSRNIGIILPSISNPFYPSIVKAMEDVAYENDYTLFLCSSDRDEGRASKHIESLFEYHVSGIITLFLDSIPEVLKNFTAHGGKVLSIGVENLNDKIKDRKLCSFYFDKETEAYVATKHLIELGHKNIALITAPLTNELRKIKIQGYKRALSEAGIEYKKEYLYIAPKEYDVEYLDNSTDCFVGTEMAKNMLYKNPEVTGILCMNDLVALGCISEIQKKGYEVPKDYSVVGFDDSFFSELIRPEITTVKFEKYNLGKLAMQTLIDIIEGNQEMKQYDFSNYAHLVIRNSSGKPRC